MIESNRAREARTPRAPGLCIGRLGVVALAVVFTGGAVAAAADSGQSKAPGQSVAEVRAAERCRTAAQHNDLKAQLELAHRYEEGKGVPRDGAEAVKWLRKAAEHGQGEALVALGDRLADGRDGPKDEAQAVRLYHQAADAGYAPGQVAMGEMCLAGRGTEKDAAAAADWFRRAADHGSTAGQRRLAWMYQNGAGVDRDPAAAVKWYLLAANHGDAEAQLQLALCYREGRGAKKDVQQEVRWLREAATQGHSQAQTELAAVSAGAYRRIARNVTYRQMSDGELVGRAVQTEGRLDKADGNRWKLALPGPGPRGQELDVDASILNQPDPPLQKTVRVYGILQPGPSIRGLVFDISPPHFRWNYHLKAPKGVVGGQNQTYSIEGTVTNDGTQTIRRVRARARLYQISSPNDVAKPFTIEDIKPGQSRSFKVDFDIYNFQYIGPSSVPRVEVDVEEYEW